MVEGGGLASDATERRFSGFCYLVGGSYPHNPVASSSAGRDVQCFGFARRPDDRYSPVRGAALDAVSGGHPSVLNPGPSRVGVTSRHIRDTERREPPAALVDASGGYPPCFDAGHPPHVPVENRSAVAGAGVPAPVVAAGPYHVTHPDTTGQLVAGCLLRPVQCHLSRIRVPILGQEVLHRVVEVVGFAVGGHRHQNVGSSGFGSDDPAGNVFVQLVPAPVPHNPAVGVVQGRPRGGHGPGAGGWLPVPTRLLYAIGW